MSQKYRRFSLKPKEAKQILSQATEELKVDLEALFGSKLQLEIVESEVAALYLVNKKPVLFKAENLVLPILSALEVTSKMPKIVVDMGAVKFVCNGADVMAPGVVRYEGNFEKGDLAVVVDKNFGKPLALGQVLYGSEEVKGVKQGPVVKNLHYVGDKVWNFAKNLQE